MAAPAAIGTRDLRNRTREVLDRVASGEQIVITLDGHPVAKLIPVPRRRPWISREEFLRNVVPRQADPGLLDELRALAPDTTDDLAW